MRIEPFDPVTADEPTAQAYAAVAAAARRPITPPGMAMPAAFLLNRVRVAGGAMRNTIWNAYDGDALVASTEAFWLEAPDNRHRAWVRLDVPGPDDALVDALAGVAAAHCAAAGRTVLTFEVEEGSALSAWVGARGGRLGSLDEFNVLPLRSLSRADVAALAAAVPAGYELVAWDGAVADDLLPAYARLMDTINDAPHDGLTLEPTVFSPERVREMEDRVTARGHVLWTVAARHVATGELVAYNQLVLRPEWPEVIENEDTAVARAHRGHGLGIWVKAGNVLRALDTPASYVTTYNAASNEHMLRVNHRLGFVRRSVIEQWELDAANLGVS